MARKTLQGLENRARGPHNTQVEAFRREYAMPIYEYRCQSCEHQFEKLQRISDDALHECPACSQPALKKLVSAAGFRLKGGGWYETDFKKDRKRNLAGESSTSSNNEAEKKPDPKPEKQETAKAATDTGKAA